MSVADRILALDQRLKSLGIPIDGVSSGPPVRVDYRPEATPAQRSQGDGIAASWDMTPRRPRTLLAIRNAIATLSTAQKNNAWAALIAGSPPLWATDAGPNAAALAVLQLLGGSSGSLSAADLLEAKVRAGAFYAQDNPNWLVNPAFDPSINVPGDEPDL